MQKRTNERTDNGIYSMSQNILPTPKVFCKNFRNDRKILNKIFIRLWCVHAYATLQNSIQLSLTLTKLCLIKDDHLVNFYTWLEL